MPFLETTSHVRGDPWGKKKKQRGGFNSLCEQTVDTVTHHIQTNLQQTKHKWGQTEREAAREDEEMSHSNSKFYSISLSWSLFLRLLFLLCFMLASQSQGH